MVRYMNMENVTGETTMKKLLIETARVIAIASITTILVVAALRAVPERVVCEECWESLVIEIEE